MTRAFPDFWKPLNPEKWLSWPVIPYTDSSERLPEPKLRSGESRDAGETKPFLRLISDRSVLNGLGLLVPDEPILDLWPGPFTFVFSCLDGGTMACRVPEDARLRKLIIRVGRPLFSTSVNRAGNPLMDNPESIDKEFGTEVALIEDSGLYTGCLSSTVADLTQRPYRILRQGAGMIPVEFL